MHIEPTDVDVNEVLIMSLFDSNWKLYPDRTNTFETIFAGKKIVLSGHKIPGSPIGTLLGFGLSEPHWEYLLSIHSDAEIQIRTGESEVLDELLQDLHVFVAQSLRRGVIKSLLGN